MMARFELLALAVLLVSLTGCATSPAPRYYLLSPLADKAVTAEANKDIILGLGPINLPKYLKRPEMVNRNTPNELMVDEYHRWGEPLEDNFSRVLGQNLARLIPGSQTVNYPWKRTAGVNYQLIVDVSQYEAVSTAEVVLDVRWEVDRLISPGDTVARKHQRYSEPSSRDHAARVAALSRLLERLSQDIAKAFDQNSR